MRLASGVAIEVERGFDTALLSAVVRTLTEPAASSNGVLEHPTYKDAVDVCTLDAKTDDAAGEHVHV